jgi:DNA recombination protein RmuC
MTLELVAAVLLCALAGLFYRLISLERRWDQKFERLQAAITDSMDRSASLQKERMESIISGQRDWAGRTESQLEKMRETVDEKLHKTLEERLGRSFKLVSDRLEAVQKGLVEMQGLAGDVGDLKKVLSNVKTSGVLGEVQLANLLEQLLTPEQYEVNARTKPGSSAHVEFAIKMPGRDATGAPVLLPIDAKFPQVDYQQLQLALDDGDKSAADAARKSLVQTVRAFAKDISSKYIAPPHTTDFAIMFLPVEGLFAEVVRQPGLIESLQRDFKVIVTGPTTLSAILHSLQMGFRTLAIQQRSSEVWDVLGAVKTEFGRFGDVLAKTQKKLGEAHGELDRLIGTRTRMMLSKLRSVEELPAEAATALLENEFDDESES